VGLPPARDSTDAASRLELVLERLAVDPDFVEMLFTDPWCVAAAYRLDEHGIDILVTHLRGQAQLSVDAAGRRRAAAAVFGLLTKLRHPSAGALGADARRRGESSP
jgi:hypothetical protein